MERVGAAIALGAALMAAGCANAPEKGSDPPEEEPAVDAQKRKPDLAVDGTRCDTRGARSEPLDTNHDGRDDIVSLYATSEQGSLRCKQADLNFDGRLDAWFHYDDAGAVVREQYDQDYDGSIDLGSYYEAGALVLDELDLNRDGFVDTWRRYDKARLTRIETDRDGDGRPDMFAYYLAGRIDRIGYDVSGDGKVDQWDHDAARRARQAEQLRVKEQQDAEGKSEAYVDEPPKKAGDDAEETEEATEADAKGKDAGKGKDAKAGDAKGKDAGKGKDAKAGDAKAKDAKTGDTKAGDAKSKDAKPGDTKAGDAKSKDAGKGTGKDEPAAKDAPKAGGKEVAPEPSKPDASKPAPAKPDAAKPSPTPVTPAPAKPTPVKPG